MDLDKAENEIKENTKLEILLIATAPAAALVMPVAVPAILATALVVPVVDPAALTAILVFIKIVTFALLNQ